MLITWQDLLDFFFPSPKKCPFCQENFLNSKELVCQDCSEKVEFLPFSPYWQEGSLGVYTSLLQDAIHKLKYQGQQTMGETLGKLLAGHIQGQLGKVHGLIPIPLHEKRLRKRGFNQAELIVRSLGEALRIDVWNQVLVRRKETTSQVGLSKEDRWTNMVGAFQVTKPDFIRGKKIIVVDDVLTTGATCREAQRVLLAAGASEVKILTVARGKTLEK